MIFLPSNMQPSNQPAALKILQIPEVIKCKLSISEEPVYYLIQDSSKAALSKQRITTAWVFFALGN